MKKQMLSWVWQGVCSALTAMLPMLKESPCLGVLDTFLQSLPPIISSWPSSESWEGQRQLVKAQREVTHKLFIAASMVPVTKGYQLSASGVTGQLRHSLVGVDDGRELD